MPFYIIKMFIDRILDVITYISISAFFYRICDVNFGGMYLTFLNSCCNIGS